MGELGAFLRLERVGFEKRDPAERVHDYREFVGTLPVAGLQEQGARCMECGVPFCHNGCPVNNLIPDWNDLVYRNRWQAASEQLHRTGGVLLAVNFDEACGFAHNAENGVGSHFSRTLPLSRLSVGSVLEK